MSDDAGIALVPDATGFSDWWNDDAIRAHYDPEMVARVLAWTGGRRALAFDHNVRFAPRMGEQAIDKPERLVHNDYTSISGPQRVRDLLGAEEAASALNRRFALVNLWRPIDEPLRDAPLAPCDARSVSNLRPAWSVVCKACESRLQRVEMYRCCGGKVCSTGCGHRDPRNLKPTLCLPGESS